MVWIDIKERIPEPGKPFYGIRDGVQSVMIYEPDCTCRYKFHGPHKHVPTHWMPLIEGPRIAKKRGLKK